MFLGHKFDQKNKNRLFYSCTCDCGNKVETHRYNLLDHITKSCGCLRKKQEKITKVGRAMRGLLAAETLGRYTKQNKKEKLERYHLR